MLVYKESFYFIFIRNNDSCIPKTHNNNIEY